MSEKKNILIAQSGGPSAAINASVAGAVTRAMASDQVDRVFGAVHGMEGFLHRQIIDIGDQIRSQDDIEQLIHTPAQALGSSRYKLPKGQEGDAVFARILSILKEYNIGYFFFNGGNDSMDTVSRLAAYLYARNEDVMAVGIPKTIDNDLMDTDHTPGFGSAARYIAMSISELYMDTIVYDKPNVVIAEIMGRNAGWLTAASVLARRAGVTAPHLIYLPEKVFDPDAFIARVKDLVENGSEQQVVVAVSEGIRLADGSYIAESGEATDVFGHVMLGGVARTLESLVKNKLGVKTRAIEFSTLQRAAAHVASQTDLDEAFQCGVRAVEAALHGITDVMIAMHRVSNVPYLVQYDATPLSNVANMERTIPLEWITEDGTDVTPEMVEYLTPLIRGEANVRMVGGLPTYFRFDWTKTIDPLV
ncbi:MAG: 6-phosphofructokinase [Clostridiales Family XIII bacterium]|nr:6-phosphofructokinase [Clostridiales Family XIII bacterium]